MYEYKVFKWRFDLDSEEELENELNKYGKDGWRIFNIVSSFKGSGNAVHASVEKRHQLLFLKELNKINNNVYYFVNL